MAAPQWGISGDSPKKLAEGMWGPHSGEGLFFWGWGDECVPLVKAVKMQELFLSATALGMPVLHCPSGVNCLCNRLWSCTSISGPSGCCCSRCGCSLILLPMLPGSAKQLYF